MKTPLALLIGMLLIHASAVLAEDAPFRNVNFTFQLQDEMLALSAGGQPVANYVFKDDRILRPYFSNVHAPGGIQVTRNHPPREGQDATDHATMHPGVWLAFGDVSGQDFWRNKAVIRHERFAEPPRIRDGRLTFDTENRLLTANGQPLGSLDSHITLAAVPAGYLLIWEATFQADQQDIVFGDQEEMGLGVRVATPITEKKGGLLTGSSGAQTAKVTWGKAFDWCDYSGVIGNRRVGLTLMPDPANFRPSWFHNRDYGLMVANPFGRKAMQQGEASRITVQKNETFRLRFGVLLHASSTEEPVNLADAFQRFQRLILNRATEPSTRAR